MLYNPHIEIQNWLRTRFRCIFYKLILCFKTLVQNMYNHVNADMNSWGGVCPTLWLCPTGLLHANKTCPSFMPHQLQPSQLCYQCCRFLCFLQSSSWTGVVLLVHLANLMSYLMQSGFGGFMWSFSQMWLLSNHIDADSISMGKPMHIVNA